MDEPLATWKVQKLEPGTYTLRLTVQDKSGEIRAETHELLTLVFPEENQINIISPITDQTISKPVIVTGSAIYQQASQVLTDYFESLLNNLSESAKLR